MHLNIVWHGREANNLFQSRATCVAPNQRGGGRKSSFYTPFRPLDGKRSFFLASDRKSNFRCTRDQQQ